MHRTTYVTACTLAVLSLGACSSDAQDDPGDQGAAPTSATASSPAGSASPSESTEPSTSPATGPALDAGSATINLPDGWTPKATGLPNIYNGTATHGADLRLISVLDLESSSVGYSLGARARDALSAVPGAKLTRQPDVELDGSPAYHVAGTAPVRGNYEVVGTGDHGRGISISFNLNGYTAAERREIVDSVVASFRWKP